MRRLTFLHHGHEKRKDSLETQAVLSIFSLELEISGATVQRIHQNSEKWWLLWGITQWKWLWRCFSHILLLWLWCQRFWGSSEDHYRSKRLSQIPFVCYSLLNSQNLPINNSEKRLVTYLRTIHIWRSGKLSDFQDPHPLPIYVQNFFTPLTLDVQV